ncbi:hypothetical protein D3C85_1444900 [compost metagenome]
MANVIKAKVLVSIFNVPALSGMCFFFANRPAIAKGPMIGMKRPKSKMTPVKTFQNILLSPKPSKPEPLLALEEVTSYSISEKPWKLGLLSQAEGAVSHAALPCWVKV